MNHDINGKIIAYSVVIACLGAMLGTVLTTTLQTYAGVHPKGNLTFQVLLCVILTIAIIAMIRDGIKEFTDMLR